MPKIVWSFVLFLGLCFTPVVHAQEIPAVKGRNNVSMRGKTQYLFFCPASSSPVRSVKVLFAPGDLGWHGTAITMAEKIASWGYDVFGLDTKQFLESLSGTTTQREIDVTNGIRQLAEWLAPNPRQSVALVGWSEGAGIVVLAAASPGRQEKYCGVVTMGLGDSNVLGWTWRDDLTYLTKRDPIEPAFSSLLFVDKIAPLPLVMLQSSRDEYVPQEEAQRLCQRAKEPKKFFLIDARNHRFEGNPDEFYRRLSEALEWINSPNR